MIGSRYVVGGSVSSQWGRRRRLGSRFATLLARPVTRARDPMSGFFALRRDVLDRAKGLKPSGYKIALELMVKCRVQRVNEVPIHFSQRQAGESKLSATHLWRFALQIARLTWFRYVVLRRPPHRL